ncbi:hypothetical protein KBC86_05015, partial [Candidatus Gracilibacteria bacterium]|nr:hypothetical protein [Candidatus Gracilibacteria bacterium]
VLTDTVTGISSTENYSYGSGNYYYDSTDIWGREYVGFARVSIRDNKTDKTLYFHQSQTASPDPLKYQDHIAKKGRPYLTEIRDSIIGKLLSRELTRYDMRMKKKWLGKDTTKISGTWKDLILCICKTDYHTRFFVHTLRIRKIFQNGLTKILIELFSEILRLIYHWRKSLWMIKGVIIKNDPIWTAWISSDSGEKHMKQNPYLVIWQGDSECQKRDFLNGRLFLWIWGYSK